MLLLSIVGFWCHHRYTRVSIFVFPFFFVKKRIDLVLSFPKWMFNLLSTNQSHILEKFLVSSSFILSRSLCWNYKHVSSAERNRSQSTACGMLFIYNRNNNGPIMDSCGTLHCKLSEVVNFLWTFTWNFLLDRYDLYQSITSRENPSDDIFRSKILWSIVLNAFWSSIKITPVKRPESKPLDILSVK